MRGVAAVAAVTLLRAGRVSGGGVAPHEQRGRRRALRRGPGEPVRSQGHGRPIMMRAATTAGQPRCVEPTGPAMARPTVACKYTARMCVVLTGHSGDWQRAGMNVTSGNGGFLCACFPYLALCTLLHSMIPDAMAHCVFSHSNYVNMISVVFN